MKLHNILTICIVSLIFLLSIPLGRSVSLGTYQKEYFIKSRPGESIELHILFWSYDKLHISMKKIEVPEGWFVFFSPENFSLPSEKGENIYLPTQGFVKAFVEKIYVKIPSNAKEGLYSLTFSAVAGKGNKEISVLQERDFKFKIEVGNISGEEIPIITIGNKSIEEMHEQQDYGEVNFLFLIGVVLIILISYLIYKK